MPEIQLARGQTASPRLAVRWLRRQAVWLAGLLDPDPAAPWLRSAPLVAVGGPDAPDPAAGLRAWTDDGDQHAQAMSALVSGSLYVARVVDADAAYLLTARPIGAPLPRRADGTGWPVTVVTVMPRAKVFRNNVSAGPCT